MLNKVKNGITSILKWIALSPLLKTALAVVPMVWKLIILDFFGSSIGFIDPTTKTATDRGIFVTIFVYSFIGLFLLITNLYVHNVAVTEKSYADLAKKILKRIHNLYTDKLDKQQDSFLKFTQSGEEIRIDHDIKKRILKVLSGLLESFKDIIDISDPEDISVSVFYHFDNIANNWEREDWHHHPIFPGATANDVMTHPESFGTYMLRHGYNFCLLNDKYKDGVKHKEIEEYEKNGVTKRKRVAKKIYKLNQRDYDAHAKTGKYGSIIGQRLIVKRDDETKYIEAVIIVSTYGRKVDDSPLGIFRDSITECLEEIVFPYFEMNIKTELMYLYESTH